jgi:hypothetical protein
MMEHLPTPAAHWAALRSEKLEWAYRAYRRFIAELSDDVSRHLKDGESARAPYVVVFGMTQVGKTTLLLELMGLGIEAQARVGKVLRGGRETGKSATATTMEYRRSPDRDWRFDDGTGIRRIAGDGEMCVALGELRQRMSERRLLAEAPVVVSIPEDCFEPGSDGLATRMLDLPGDNPADEVERKHVEQMAARYVPHADLILLVGRGDHLSFLNPEVLTLPSIEDWQYVPNRFRVITTYSYTPETVQKFARDHDGELRAEHFRARLLEQIATFGLTLSPDAARPERYFPLEIGQSWKAMLDEDSEIAQRVAPIVKELKARLHEDIRNSATEAARFRNALDVHVVTRRKREARIKEGKTARAALRAAIKPAETTAEQALNGKQEAARRAQAAKALLAKRAAVEKELADALVFDATEHVEGVDSARTNTSALFSRINDASAWLRQRFLDASPSGSDARKFFGSSRPDLAAQADKVKRIADDEFSTLIARMNGYSLDEYYPTWSNSFSDDKSRLKQDIQDAAEKTAALSRNLWRKHVAKRVAELEAEATAADSEAASLEQIARQQQRKCDKLRSQSAKVREDLSHALARLKGDKETAARFGTMLDEEYLAELRQRRVRLAAAKQPADALLTLLSVADLGEERKKITLS